MDPIKDLNNGNSGYQSDSDSEGDDVKGKKIESNEEEEDEEDARSISEELLDQDFDDWEGDEEDEENEPTQPLLAEEIAPSASLALQRDRELFGFDFNELRKRLGLDLYRTMRLINYIRFRVAENRSPFDDRSFTSRKELEDHLKCFATDPSKFDIPLDAPFWKDDKYLLPVLPGDPLLRYFSNIDFDEEEEEEEQEHQKGGEELLQDASSSSSSSRKSAKRKLESDLEERKEKEKADLQESIDWMKERLEFVRKDVQERSGVDLVAYSKLENRKK